MAAFQTGCRVQNDVDRTRSVRVEKALVDTGSEYTWIPAGKLERIGVVHEKRDLRFIMATGEVVTRSGDRGPRRRNGS
jgi:predicted aspartyl protease